MEPVQQREARNNMIDQIAGAIRDFERETELLVTEVILHRMSKIDSPGHLGLPVIELKVALPHRRNESYDSV